MQSLAIGLGGTLASLADCQAKEVTVLSWKNTSTSYWLVQNPPFPWRVFYFTASFRRNQRKMSTRRNVHNEDESLSFSGFHFGGQPTGSKNFWMRNQQDKPWNWEPTASCHLQQDTKNGSKNFWMRKLDLKNSFDPPNREADLEAQKDKNTPQNSVIDDMWLSIQ